MTRAHVSIPALKIVVQSLSRLPARVNSVVRMNGAGDHREPDLEMENPRPMGALNCAYRTPGAVGPRKRR